jgi:hypothetical protein
MGLYLVILLLLYSFIGSSFIQLRVTEILLRVTRGNECNIFCPGRVFWLVRVLGPPTEGRDFSSPPFTLELINVLVFSFLFFFVF